MTVKFRYHTATEFTGDTAVSLDRFVTATILADAEDHFCWVINVSGGEISLYYFNKSSTAVTSAPDTYRNADYATAGVWELMDSPFDVSTGIESGDVRTFLVETPPTGYLELNGSTISRTTYSDIFAAIGTLGGVGDGVNDFELPDFRGRFVRGWDNGVGLDPDAASRTDSGDGSTTGDKVGTKQADGHKTHNHIVYTRPGTDSGSGRIGATSTTAYTYASQVSASTGGNETRPANINVMWCIKI